MATGTFHMLPGLQPAVGITGHRPHKLVRYSLKRVEICVRARLRVELIQLNPRVLISGMALGVDQWAVQVAAELGIPYVAAIPHDEQEKPWPKLQRERYWRLLQNAQRIVQVSRGGFTHSKMQLRNEYIVRMCDVLLAVWDGQRGGTANCVHFANTMHRPVIRINPSDMQDGAS